MKFRKVFDTDGDMVVRFAAESKEQITEWLSGVPYDFAINYGIEIDNCPVFGKALDFPCKIIEIPE